MKDIILNHIEKKQMNLLKAMLDTAEEIEILHAFHSLPSDEQVIVFKLLKKDNALRIFEELDTDEQVNLLGAFKHERVIEYVNELAPDDRVQLLDELPASVAKKLISALSPEERAVTNLLMGYKPETAGRIMTTEFIRLSREMTVSEALEKVRKLGQDMETVYALYITDNSKVLEGVISLKELVCASGTAKIEDLMAKKAISVTTDTDQEEVARTLQDLDLLAIPVVDKESRVVGIVTIDDAIDILEDEASEDIYDAAGFADPNNESNRSEVLINGTLWKIWKVRLPFLLATLVLGMLSGLVIDGFEETLEAMTAVAIFIPVIMGMGGNIGTQSSTVFARGLVLGQIQINNFLRPFFKEIGIGLSIGVLIGVISGAVAAFWLGMPMLGVAVGVAMTITMTAAALLGFLVPYVLVRLNADQAAGSAPIVTTLKDLVALLIYFACITLFMRNIM